MRTSSEGRVDAWPNSDRMMSVTLLGDPYKLGTVQRTHGRPSCSASPKRHAQAAVPRPLHPEGPEDSLPQQERLA